MTLADTVLTPSAALIAHRSFIYDPAKSIPDSKRLLMQSRRKLSHACDTSVPSIGSMHAYVAYCR